jgi:glycogen operon protein
MAEVRAAVAALQAAGIAVVQDIVLNHSGEGDALGPTLSLRGLGNATYYRHREGRLADDAGCGNTLALDRPWPLRLAMDALRHWAEQAGLDGFRLDLATTLGRRAHGFDPDAPLIQAMRQDPVLRERLIIAEPWDIGRDGYQLGRFPAGWGEWNDRFRDDVRRFWRGDAGMLGALATRLAASADAFGARSSSDSVNFVTAHDGFTLADLVSYEHKHNEDNGEDNRDGHDHNISWNHGVEGPTDDPEIIAARERSKRNFMATLLFSQGVPMICGGDEISRTQQGNNNAYCQDNEISWYDWNLTEREQEMLDFTQRLIAYRKAHPILHRRKFFQGRRIHGSDIRDITWFRPDGEEMSDEEWEAGWVRTIGVRLGGEALNEFDANGDRIIDDTLLLLINAHHDPIDFAMVAKRPTYRWERVFDTASPQPDPEPVTYKAGTPYKLEGRSLALFRRIEDE